MTPTPPEELLQQIEEKISKLDLPVLPAGLYDAIKYKMGLGGKRLRPLLTLLACRMFGGNVQEALSPALAIEIFHNFTLVHDDIMDAASVRRGKPTVHTKWNAPTAILAGDAMLVIAYEHLMSLPAENLSPALALFSKTAKEVCEGQQWDMLFENKKEVALNSYLQMIKLKTAVLLGAALKMGAIVAGAPENDAKKVYDFGINMGLAFQLRDDLLDVFGAPETFGKKMGGDIVANKKTYLLIRAMEAADEAQKQELQYWLGRNSDAQHQEKIARIKEIYRQLEVDKHTSALMEEYFTKGLSLLNEINGDEAVKKQFAGLAMELMKREK